MLLTEEEINKSKIIYTLAQIGKPAVPFLLKRLLDPEWERASGSILIILFNRGI